MKRVISKENGSIVSKQNLNQRAIAVALSPSKYGFSFSIATLIDSDNHNDIKIIMFFLNVSNILRLTIPSYIKQTYGAIISLVCVSSIDQINEGAC